MEGVRNSDSAHQISRAMDAAMGTLPAPPASSRGPPPLSNPVMVNHKTRVSMLKGSASSTADVNRNYVRRISNLPISVSRGVSNDNEPLAKKNAAIVLQGLVACNGDSFTPPDDVSGIVDNPYLAIAFNIYETTALVFRDCSALSRPANTYEWCLAIIQQRWYQSIGWKLQIGAAEFLDEAERGREYLMSFNRWINPQENVIHLWGLEIMEEIKLHVSDPEKAQINNFDDGSWKIPSAIVPELVEVLPLSLPNRLHYFRQLCFMVDEVGKQCDSTSKEVLDIVHVEFSKMSEKIGKDLKSDFNEMYSPHELHRIQQNWIDDLESAEISDENSEDKENYEWVSVADEETEGRSASLYNGDAVERYSEAARALLIPPAETVQKHASIPRNEVDKQESAIQAATIPPVTVPTNDNFDWADEADEFAEQDKLADEEKRLAGEEQRLAPEANRATRLPLRTQGIGRERLLEVFLNADGGFDLSDEDVESNDALPEDKDEPTQEPVAGHLSSTSGTHASSGTVSPGSSGSHEDFLSSHEDRKSDEPSKGEDDSSVRSEASSEFQSLEGNDFLEMSAEISLKIDREPQMEGPENLKALINDLNAKSSQLVARIERRDIIIAQLAIGIDNRDTTVIQLEDKLENRDTTIARLEATIRNRDTTLAKLGSEIETRDATIKELEVGNEHLGIIDAQLKARIQELENANVARHPKIAFAEELTNLQSVDMTAESETPKDRNGGPVRRLRALVRKFKPFGFDKAGAVRKNVGGENEEVGPGWKESRSYEDLYSKRHSWW